MLVLKSFFRKKNNFLYLIINLLVFMLISILLICNEYLLCQFDLEYKDAKIVVISDKELSLNSKIYYIDDVKKDDNKYYHEVKFYHWFDYQEKMNSLTEDINDDDIDIIPEFNTSDNKRIEQMLQLFNYALIIIIVGYIIFIVIVLFNVIFDNKHSITLLRYLGFKDIIIGLFFLLEVLSLFLIPLSIVYIIFKLIMILLF